MSDLKTKCSVYKSNSIDYKVNAKKAKHEGGKGLSKNLFFFFKRE